jgi:putative transcriptional regulator
MRKTKSAILKAVRETARGLHAAGVMGQVTLREFVLKPSRKPRKAAAR